MGTLQSGSADFINTFITKANSITEMVQLVIDCYCLNIIKYLICDRDPQGKGSK